ncbi:MAG TPA: hypothetical protein VFB49_09705 [Patescibacteria group bacterium]|nr:hypothetical protein [Patescibacteria group bacterium]
MNGKSIWAVVAGVLFIVVVTTLVDALAGAWITARLAPQKPMKHALILGGVGVALGLVGVVATWNLGLGPRWYPIALVVLALPQCWAGAKLYGIGR